MRSPRRIGDLTLVVDGVDRAISVEGLSVGDSGRSVSGTFVSELTGAHYVYLRVEVEALDGVPDLAWTSPIFFRDP